MTDDEVQERDPVSLGNRETSMSNSKDRNPGVNLLYSALACFLLAGLFYLLEFFLETKNSTTFAHIAQHLSIAFLVALISIVLIEYNAKRRTEQEFRRYRRLVAEDVFDAVIERLVPDQILREIREILRCSFIKTDCQYTIRFMKPYANMSPDFCVVRRDLRFTVTNISEKPAVFPVHSYYSGDKNLADSEWKGRPFHLELEVDLKPVPREKFLADQPRGFKMEYDIRLKPKDSVRIFLRGEEPLRLEASRCFYYQGTPVDGLEVFIENNYDEAIGTVDVQMHHPGSDEVENDRERHTLRRAFLPGQGFEVIWKKAEAPSATEQKETALER